MASQNARVWAEGVAAVQAKGVASPHDVDILAWAIEALIEERKESARLRDVVARFGQPSQQP